MSNFSPLSSWRKPGAHYHRASLLQFAGPAFVHNHKYLWCWVLAFARTTKRGCSRPEQPRILRLVSHAGEVGAEGRAAEIIQRRGHSAAGGRGHYRLERRKHALAVRLPERNE